MRLHPGIRRLVRGSVAVPLFLVLLAAVPASASGDSAPIGGLGWSANSTPANVIPGPSGGAASPDVIVGGGGGAAMLATVPYYALPQDNADCNTDCQDGWTDLIDKGASNGGPIQYVIVNVCVPETIDDVTYQTGPGCDGETWYNTDGANWSVGGGPEDWKTTIENLDGAGIIPLVYMNTFWDANSNPNTCGTSGTAACAYTKGDIEAEQNTVADWWCYNSDGACTSASRYQITNFYYDNMSLDSVYGTTATGSPHCDTSLAGYTSGALCNETYYDDIITHEDDMSMDSSGDIAFLNAGNWVDNPGIPADSDGYTSWDGNASTCRLGGSGSSCGEDWLDSLDEGGSGITPVINWEGSESQFDCDYNSSYCSGTLDGVGVGSLTHTAFPSWMATVDNTNFSFINTDETVLTDTVSDQGLNENAWLDNEFGDAVDSGFWFGYETDETDGAFTNEATLADNEWSDINNINGDGGYVSNCAKNPPSSGQPTDPAETGYTLTSSNDLRGATGLPTDWYYFEGWPGGVTTSFWLNGVIDTWDSPEINPNGDNAVAFDANGANFGNDLTYSGVNGSGGLGGDDPVATNGALEWCARDSNNDSALHDVAVLWPSLPAITDIVGNSSTATVTTASDNYLETGDYVDIVNVSTSPDDCYNTSATYGVPITVTSSTTFTYTTACEDSYTTGSGGSGGDVGMWPPELDLVETNGSNSFTMTYHYNDDTGSGSDSSCYSSAVTSVPLQDFNIFELTWTASTITLYADGTSVATLSNASGQNCAGIAFPHVPMTFDFDQENTSNATPATTNQQTDLSWVSTWS